MSISSAAVEFAKQHLAVERAKAVAEAQAAQAAQTAQTGAVEEAGASKRAGGFGLGLHESAVCVVGAGTMAKLLVTHLAGSGVKNITLVSCESSYTGYFRRCEFLRGGGP